MKWLALLMLMFAIEPASRPAGKTLRIVLAGDSTVTEKQGWGLGFKDLVADDVELINLARGGRSSKSFREEGLWDECLKLRPDYILIQFGHNDEPGKGLARETDASTTYYENMKRYVDEARAIGAKPVLVTSMTRRQFKEDEKIHSSLIPYVDAVKRVAAEKSVPLVDLHARSIEYFEKLGPVGWHHLSTMKEDGKWDATHLNAEGSRAVAPLIVAGLGQAVPELASHLKVNKEITVAPDGSGQFKSVQSAIDSIAQGKDRVIVQIKGGEYTERVRISKDKPPITLRSDGLATRITYKLSAKELNSTTGQPVGTSESYTVLVESSDFIAENITFENSAGEGAGQAVALRTTGDRNAFYKCKFIGNQDTLYAHQGRCYFKDCFVEGRVDFIFGRSTAVFENCEIHSKNGGYVTASASTPEQKFGFVFIRCNLTAEGDKKTYLGRPWKTGAATAFIQCELGGHIDAEGWSIWKGNENHKTARYSEYKNTGPGAKPESRIPWSKQLSDDEAKQYTLENIFGDWKP